MKKHHKLNLDELADRMEGIGREEQESSVGGEVYVSPEGKYLGESSGNSYMMIISESDYRNGLMNQSISFAFLGQDEQNTILSGIAGIPCQVYSSSNSSEFGTTPWYKNEFGLVTADNIGLNSYGDVMRSNNYWDILSVLKHESCHYTLGYNEDRFHMEYMALYWQTNDPYFNRCSAGFNAAITRTWHFYQTGVYW